MEHVGGVLVMQLPVAPIFEVKTAVGENDFAIGSTVDQIVDRVRHLAEMVAQRWSIGSETGKDKAAVAVNARRLGKVVARIVEAKACWIALAVRHPLERAIRRITPSVIGTDEGGAIAAIDRAKARAAMGADCAVT